ncbi:Gfo/Idh/MocA family oxidoreductase [Streptomyces canus]|uniref:Gfo/Idh/MocA family protein n=1 Tax=Streptomyces canus TaxID=58343 RepID=UPI002E29732A|nr:Gfo/Idh/MocA family oxidoreductase [Streptomyces canus]
MTDLNPAEGRRRATGEVGIALVGCGRAAQQHVEAVALAGGGRVVAVVDDNAERAERFARQNAATPRHLDDVLGDSRIDAVSVCTPPGTHASIAVAALRAGKAVIVEKPVTRTGEELDAILAAADATGAPALAMLQHRGRLPAAALSTPWTADASAVLEVFRPRPRGHYFADPWRHDPDRSGGGHVAHLAVHLLDVSCQLLGMPARVSGLTGCRDVEGIDTRAALGVQFADGALMSVLASAHPAPRGERLRVVDGERELLIEDFGGEYRQNDTVHRLQPVPTPQLRSLVYQELHAAVRGEAAPDRYALRQARGVTAVLEAVRRLVMTVEEPVA